MPARKKHKTQRTKHRELCSFPKKSLSAVSCPSSRRAVGIGIDLLALDRARDLMKRHGKTFFTRILSPYEIKQDPACTALQLAKYFTAKEAFFKSSGLPWTDLKGFTGMWITRMRGKYFEMGCIDSQITGRGEFFQKGGNWGAKVQVWKD